MTERTARTDGAARSGGDADSRAGNDADDRTGNGADSRADNRAGNSAGSRAGNDRDPLGSAAEEAFKLFDALQQKATRELRKNLIRGTVRGTMSGLGGAFSGGFSSGDRSGRDVWGEAVSEHDEYICRACPVCRAMAAQRESGGAVADHLMQAGSELFAAFKTAVDGLNKPSPGQRARERDRTETPVEHIDLG